MPSLSLIALLALGTSTLAQLQSQNFTYNSSFILSGAQIAAANLSDVEISNFEVALNFERSGWAGGGSVLVDPFYQIPDSFDPANPPPPGTVLKVEKVTPTSRYTLPPSLAMSRFLYTTETYNGTSIPASAYVLWPYTPRRFSHLTSCGNSSGPVFPLVALAHGSTGATSECAPSHFKNLGDEFHEPFPLALAGYAIVAPDYAGYGAHTETPPYFVLPAQANDLAHAVTAAQSAFPQLSKQFVAMGQSQGAGVTWSFAQRQASRPLPGYLGTVAVSPFTDIYGSVAVQSSVQANVRILGIAQGLASVIPSFNISDWITDFGLSRLPLIQETRACILSSGTLLLGAAQVLKTGWQNTESGKKYFDISNNGNRSFAGPLLVLQGDLDANANYKVTAANVNSTCQLFPNNTLHYQQYAGISHVPTLYASQMVWLDWIRDRFAGVQLQPGCVKEGLNASTGVANGAGQNWQVIFDEFAL